jgi:hypothetical protein
MVHLVGFTIRIGLVLYNLSIYVKSDLKFKIYLFPTQFISVLCMDLIINIDCFSTQRWLTSLQNGNRLFTVWYERSAVKGNAGQFSSTKVQMLSYELIALALQLNSPISLSLLYQPNNISRGLQIMKLLIRKFSLASSDFLPLRPDNPSSTRYNWTTSVCVPPFLWETRFHIRAE